MRIISWNINGIRAVHKKGLLVPFVEKYRPEIMCFQETKAEQNQSEVDLPEYEEYWNSATKKGYSGTAIFTKEKPLSIINDLPEKIFPIAKQSRILDKVGTKKYNLVDKYGNPNTEGRVIAAEYKDFYLVNVYTPNSKDDLSRIPLRHKIWDPAFLEYIKNLERRGKPVIFCGDLNVAHTPLDLARPKENEGRKGFTLEEREGIDKIISAGYLDTFRIFTKDGGHYSWWTHFSNARARNIGWRIDYIFASAKLKDEIKGAGIFPSVMGSDHAPIWIELTP